MNNWKVIFATAVIFGAGVLTGGLLVNFVQRSERVPFHSESAARVRATAGHTEQNTRPHLPKSLSRQFLQKLDKALKLTPKQRESVRKIIGEGQGQICKAIRDARSEICKVLTPRQRKKFEELIKCQVHRTVYNRTNATEKAEQGSREKREK